MALEHVDGGTLKEKVAGVPQPPRDAAQMVETLARAVQHAHEHRLIHRDLKPHNVLMTAGGVPKVADFGLARSLDTGAGITMTTDFVGTPAYAAPEQVATRFGPIGPATDVYSLGVVLYELLAGRVPFDTGAIPEVLRMVTDSEPVAPRRLRPGIPRDRATICLKCVRQEPGKRYASATDLADDLHHFQAGEPIAARPVGKLERAVRWCRRNPAVAALLGAVFTLLTLVAVGATVAAVRIDDVPASAPTTTQRPQARPGIAKPKPSARRNGNGTPPGRPCATGRRSSSSRSFRTPRPVGTANGSVSGSAPLRRFAKPPNWPTIWTTSHKPPSTNCAISRSPPWLSRT